MVVKKSVTGFIISVCSILFSCAHSDKAIKTTAKPKNSNDMLPGPYETKSTKNFSKVTGWQNGAMPIAPAGFTVTKFAEGLEHPRWIYVGSNGDVFVAESNTILKGLLKFGAKISRKIKTQHIGVSANRITMFRDADRDGIPEQRFVFAENLNQPFGMLILNNHFYVGNTDALVQFNYKTGDTKLNGTGKAIVSLPAGKHNRHWARNIITNKKGDKIYIAVGSGTNVAEKGLENEIRRADILEVNPDGSGERIYASGLRNPVGMDWAPGTNVLWTAVNERDELGDELVPDYLTGVIDGGFYGWPFAYYGKHEDPRMKDQQRPDLVGKSITPDVSLGSHTASLGLVFYDKKAFPAKYSNGAFIGQHGSWNRKELSGYKVVFVPFSNGKPAGQPEDFLTGFKVEGSSDSEVRGRPVCVALLPDGSMLVTDDVSNTIWRVSANK
ncbi:MAG: sorbosone dehydrogenase family protein [Aquabacterium sp.]|nr:sorbosone dehydrogenase family protein [Ferruginibacter sp.]